MSEHTGFHEYKDGKKFNPECQACREIELEEQVAMIPDKQGNPIGVDAACQIIPLIEASVKAQIRAEIEGIKNSNKKPPKQAYMPTPYDHAEYMRKAVLNIPSLKE